MGKAIVDKVDKAFGYIKPTKQISKEKKSNFSLKKI